MALAAASRSPRTPTVRRCIWRKSSTWQGRRRPRCRGTRGCPPSPVLLTARLPSPPPGLVIVRFGADLRSAMIDLTRRRRKFLLGDLTDRGHLLAELLLPLRGVREGNEVARPFIQFGERRPGFGLFDVVAHLQKDLLQVCPTRNFIGDSGFLPHFVPLRYRCGRHMRR